MNLVKVTKLIPVRNEKYEIYKWDESVAWLHPWNIQAMTWIDEVKLWGVVLTNGKETFIKETPEEMNRLLEDAS